MEQDWSWRILVHSWIQKLSKVIIKHLKGRSKLVFRLVNWGIHNLLMSCQGCLAQAVNWTGLRSSLCSQPVTLPLLTLFWGCPFLRNYSSTGLCFALGKYIGKYWKEPDIKNKTPTHVKNVTNMVRGQLWCPQLIRSAKYPGMHTHSVLEDYTVDQHCCSICSNNIGKRTVSTVTDTVWVKFFDV